MRRASPLLATRSVHLTLALVPGLLISTGCNLHSVKPVELDKSTVKPGTLTLEANKDVDVLFVIDNSGSMGDEQGKLAQNFPAFIDVLEDPDVDANYRLGITTTDNGNVECSGTSPEGGKLRLSSCTSRPDEFLWPKINPTVDAYEVACNSVCPPEVGDNLAITPTATANDPEQVPRPWIERIEGVSNVEGGTTTEAFQCFGPQGVDGCGFEAQLESMFKAIQRASVTTEQQYDFIRDQAILAVVHVTDEADCSANEDQQPQVFDRNLPASQKVFWSDPDSNIPTSAICWNAGVQCSGSGIYDDCQSQNYAADGTPDPATPSDEAVLRPVDRYTNLLQTIEDQKRNFDSDQEVIVAVLGGVPLGYAEGQADLVYQASADPLVQANFGVDYGCVSSGGAGEQQTAVPPVRLREFAEAFNNPTDSYDRNIFSICADDYSPALQAVADAIEQQVRPGCFQSCAKDLDETTPDVLDFSCRITQEDGATGQSIELEPCENGALPPGAAACYVAKSGDELDDECARNGWNLEFDIVRDPTKPVPANTKVEATCELADFPELSCPLP